jgi:hypothetical protein
MGLVACAAMPTALRAQDDAGAEKHGRKYKAPPESAHIEVTVIKGFNKKPIMNAAVIFHPIDANGKDEGTLEVKSGPDGKAIIDIIPVGSQVRLQVLANGFTTYAQDFKIDSASRDILVSMVRPQAQISAYTDNEGKPAEIQPGIQEPVRKKKAPNSSTSSGLTSGSGTSTGQTAPQTTSKPQ